MDPVTIFIVVMLMMLANGWVLGLMRKDFPAALRPCTETWRTATLLLAGSAVLYAFQYQMPLGLASPLANGLVMLGCTGYQRALRQFYGLPDPRWLFAPALVGFIGILWFAVLAPDTRMRVFILSVCCTFLLLASFVLLVSQKAPEGVHSRRVVAGLFALVAGFMVFRAAYFLGRGVSPSFDITGDGAWINIASPMITALLPVVGTTAFLMMCSERIGRQWELAASTDYLTGLPNRRTLVTVGERRFVEMQRPQGRSLALAVIDIDHFKSTTAMATRWATWRCATWRSTCAPHAAAATWRPAMAARSSWCYGTGWTLRLRWPLASACVRWSPGSRCMRAAR